MGSRVERVRKQKKEKSKYRFEVLTIIVVLFIFYLGLKTTEKSIQELTYVQDQHIFLLNLEDKPSIQLFGKTYNLNIANFIKEFIKNIK
ncbi:hypothetical protein [Sporanaerobacter sp.]|jgi:hypothetical protein|uniref:hypothetical protein n=1 Tax=Sporanaerobacter sp. TaxID=2010183 RepID=UPI003A0FC524